MYYCCQYDADYGPCNILVGNSSWFRQQSTYGGGPHPSFLVSMPRHGRLTYFGRSVGRSVGAIVLCLISFLACLPIAFDCDLFPPLLLLPVFHRKDKFCYQAIIKVFSAGTLCLKLLAKNYSMLMLICVNNCFECARLKQNYATYLANTPFGTKHSKFSSYQRS